MIDPSFHLLFLLLNCWHAQAWYRTSQSVSYNYEMKATYVDERQTNLNNKSGVVAWHRVAWQVDNHSM